MICTYNSIKSDLEGLLSPDFLEIIDQSGLHSDHYDKCDEQIISHLKVIIYSKLFDNKSIVECHRLVKNALKKKFNEGLHALTIEIKK
jgi:BolA protein